MHLRPLVAHAVNARFVTGDFCHHRRLLCDANEAACQCNAAYLGRGTVLREAGCAACTRRRHAHAWHRQSVIVATGSGGITNPMYIYMYMYMYILGSRTYARRHFARVAFARRQKPAGHIPVVAEYPSRNLLYMRTLKIQLICWNQPFCTKH